uniref:Uncharacterized protein n=1 Tax=Physcomitrium patens TaxID=3218 RepID=A0A7I3ZCR9_PHYPA
MGAFLREKKRLRCWERALQKLKSGRELDGDENNSNYKIWKILRVSFDNLKDDEKKMFLDICYFFCNDVYPQGMSKKEHCEYGLIVIKTYWNMMWNVY